MPPSAEILRSQIRLRYAHQKTGGPQRWFHLAVHPDEASMRTAAARHSPEDPTGFMEAVGCFHPAPSRERYDKKTDRWHPIDFGYGGLIRFTQGWVDAEVVAHEAVHAALRVYRMDVDPRADLGEDSSLLEETFAYLVGDITQQLTDALYRLGVWAK